VGDWESQWAVWICIVYLCSAFGDAAATNVTVDATNGFRIRNATTDKFSADTLGNLSITEDLTVGTHGIIRSAGATNLATGTGFYLAGGTTPVCRVGNPSGNQLKWDGTTLTIAGNGAGITSISGGNITTGSIETLWRLEFPARFSRRARAAQRRSSGISRVQR
jgi:hypothetical protein